MHINISTNQRLEVWQVNCGSQHAKSHLKTSATRSVEHRGKQVDLTAVWSKPSKREISRNKKPLRDSKATLPASSPQKHNAASEGWHKSLSADPRATFIVLNVIPQVKIKWQENKRKHSQRRHLSHRRRCKWWHNNSRSHRRSLRRWLQLLEPPERKHVFTDSSSSQTLLQSTTVSGRVHTEIRRLVSAPSRSSSHGSSVTSVIYSVEKGHRENPTWPHSRFSAPLWLQKNA